MRFTPPLVVVSALALFAACSEPLDPTSTPMEAITANQSSVSVSQIIPSPDSIGVGQVDTLSQKLTDGKTTWYGQNCTWSVSDASIASITNHDGGWKGDQGILKGLKTGTVTVTVRTQFGTSKSISVRVVASGGSSGGSSSGTTIYPGTSIQSKVNSYPGGTTFYLKSGVHRLQTITPKTGDSFIGEAGTVISGARVLTGWTRSGSYWYVGNQTQQAPTKGTCSSGYSGCIYPEDLFINGVMLQHVTSLSQVSSTKWYFDYGANKIYIGTDPSGKTVETSVLQVAFNGTASNVTIRNLTVEKYAVPADLGAIYPTGGSGWVVDGVTIQYNHGGGIKMNNGMHLINSHINNNGLQGIASYQVSNLLVQGNEIAYNNNAHYDPFWSGGGTKFYSTKYLTVTGNNVHHNYGKGLWTDHENQYVTYSNNTVTDNAHQGILHEISYDAVIKNNTVLRNGFQDVGGYAGAGISLTCSSNVEITGNTVSGNAHGIFVRQYNRGSGSQGFYQVKNLYVHDNTVTMSTGASGMLQNIGDNSYYTSKNNRFVHNTYYLNGMAKPFYWMNNTQSVSGWKNYGQDVTGTFK